VLEPLLALPVQARLWTAGYGILAVLLGLCAWAVFRTEKGVRTLYVSGEPPQRASQKEKDCAAVSPVERWRWVALAFVPSSLMLSVTTYLTTDIAAIPLLWVLPLALYLLSFVLVFARKPLLPWALPIRILPATMLILALALLAQATEPVWLLLPLHLTAFFIVALACHGELARRRPSVEHLTEYYFWLGVGGMLGGVFNAIISPLIFPTIVEYPLVLVLACLLRPPFQEGQALLDRELSRRSRHPHQPEAQGKAALPPLLAAQVRVLVMDVVPALSLGLVAAALILGVRALGLDSRPLKLGLAFGLPAAICYTMIARPVRFGLGLGALFLAGALYPGDYGATLLSRRSFFGVHRVTLDPTATQHLLVHGSTVHGRQDLREVFRRQPLTYYHRTGPIGRVFTSFRADPEKRRRIAVVGLGAGSLAAYGQPGEEFTFYEIDPVVEHIARDERYFTFLHDCRARVDVILGDARLKLQEDGPLYDLLVIDAFTSDAIPLHLLTREALAMYKCRLAPGGLLAFNISNRYLDLEPVLGGLASDAGLLAWVGRDLLLTDSERKEGKSPSLWVLMAREQSDLGPLAESARWEPLASKPGARVWTDDFSNLFGVFRWIE
jgi:hypothetical protein